MDTYPTRTGASRGNLHEVLVESLAEAAGPALADDVDSYVYAEHVASARALAYLVGLAERLRNQSDPDRLTDFLSRWEKLVGVRPAPGDTDTDRRARVRAKVEIGGQPPTAQVVRDLCSILLGDVFGSVVHTSSADAVGYIPGGASVSGGATLGDGPWYSTIAHVAIETLQPAGMSEADYYEATAELGQYLDDMLPAWTTWDAFLDGDNGAGFYLDEDRNLDNQRFD